MNRKETIKEIISDLRNLMKEQDYGRMFGFGKYNSLMMEVNEAISNLNNYEKEQKEWSLSVAISCLECLKEKLSKIENPRDIFLYQKAKIELKKITCRVEALKDKDEEAKL